MRAFLNKLSIAVALTALFASGAAQAIVTITSYDITNARASGFGGWSYTYNGTSTTNGSLVNLSGGSGTLNDGIIPTSYANNQLFTLSDNSVITLHMDSTYAFSDINLFGGNYPSNSIPGTLSGATVTIDGVSAAISSTGWGSNCTSGLCNDTLSLQNTALWGLTSNTITLSNFTGGWNNYFNLGEIATSGTIVSSVPEPETYAMFLAGLGLIGFSARRKKNNI